MLHPGRLLALVSASCVALHAQVPPQTLPLPPVLLAAPAKPSPGLAVSSAVELPPLLQGRAANIRAALSKRAAMQPYCEAGVLRALHWLKAQQNADGSWGENNRSAMTGLALLALLGHGEKPDSADFGLTVSMAIQWVLDHGNAHAGRLHMGDAFQRNSDVYEHGILTYALAEYYAITRDARVADLLGIAVSHIVRGQGPGGGWMYNFDQTANDLSVGSWQIQALRLAQVAGFNTPEVDTALKRAGVYLDRVRGPKGGYGYRGPEDRYSLTGAGIFCRFLSNGGRSHTRKGAEFLMEEAAKNRPVRYKGEHADLYAWYFHTQAMFAFGGGPWEKWRDWLQKDLPAAQSPDGSWPVPGGKAHGPQGAETVDGAIYRTTLVVLMLEAPYRYTWPVLPL